MARLALPRWRRWRWRWWSSQCLPSFVQPPARVAEDRYPKFLSCLLEKEAQKRRVHSQKTVTDPLVLFRRTSLLESLKSEVQPSEWQFPLDNYCLSSKQAFFVGSRREFWVVPSKTSSHLSMSSCHWAAREWCPLENGDRHLYVQGRCHWSTKGYNSGDVDWCWDRYLWYHMPKYSCVVPDSSTTFLYRLPIPNGHVAMMELWNMMILGC